jgi:hypothetical protein
MSCRGTTGFFRFHCIWLNTGSDLLKWYYRCPDDGRYATASPLNALRLSALVAWTFRASHSIKSGMFFALEKNKKEHRLWRGILENAG